MREIQELEGSEAGKRRAGEIEQLISEFFAAEDRFPGPKPGEPLFDALLPIRERQAELLRNLDGFGRVMQTNVREIESDVLRVERLSDWIARGAEAGMVLLLIAVGRLTYSRLYRPLNDLASAMSRYRDGDHGARVRSPQQEISEVNQAARIFNNLADKLESLEQQRYSYLAATAHDVRNPLGVIKNILHLLRKEIAARQQQELLQVVEEQVDRQQLQSGLFELRCEEVDLCALVQGAVRLWQASSKNHVLSFSCAEQPILAYVDSRRLQQVLHNLLSNAVKYSPNGGSIRASVEHTDGSVEISISDTGVGISPQEQQRIFEPFLRSKATRDFVPGTGFGLSSTRKIVHAHGGRIEVDSNFGQGSTFSLILPKQLRQRALA